MPGGIPANLRNAADAMDAGLSVHSVVSASPEQVSCPLGDEAAILNLKNTVYYGLNPVGARIWTLLQQQPRTIGELRDVLVDEYDVETRRCEADLLELLDKMRSEGLIQVRSAASAGA
jgi:Coenzyme PQQ synthesis protein D (PqqD)